MVLDGDLYLVCSRRYWIASRSLSDNVFSIRTNRLGYINLVYLNICSGCYRVDSRSLIPLHFVQEPIFKHLHVTDFKRLFTYGEQHVVTVYLSCCCRCTARHHSQMCDIRPIASVSCHCYGCGHSCATTQLQQG